MRYLKLREVCVRLGIDEDLLSTLSSETRLIDANRPDAGSAPFLPREPDHRYEVLIDALYSDKNECHVETRVTFENGSVGTLAADVKIREAEYYSPAGSAREAAA